LSIQFRFENAITLIFNLSELSHLGSLNNNYGVNVFKQWQVPWFKHDRASCVLEATAWSSCKDGDGLRNNINKKRLLLYLTSHQILFTKFWTRSQIWRDYQVIMVQDLKKIKPFERKPSYANKWTLKLTWSLFMAWKA
jgi:hypothetical protein